MNTQDYIKFIPSFLEKLKNDGMSKNVIGVSEWITEHFKKYCLSNNIETIDMEVIKEFYLKQYDIDIYNIKNTYQTSIRRPMLILIEYYETGTYYKTHQKSTSLEVKNAYADIFIKYQKEFVNPSNICMKNKKRKLWVLAHLFNYLDSKGINSLKDSSIKDITEFTLTLSEIYAKVTLKVFKSVIREAFNWFYDNKITNYSGLQIFPILRKVENSTLFTTYTTEEISKILNTIDISTKSGKFEMCVISMLVYLGIRAGDLINLKFENVDFENNKITFTQQKTKIAVTLPLIDEVKFPLIDYIKNGRNNSIDKEYIFSTLHAPYTKLNSHTTINRMITKAMNEADIDYSGRKHGTHAFRHSLATNMINQNVPISAISSVLAHSNTKTTEIYIKKDDTHLRQLSLEVPHE